MAERDDVELGWARARERPVKDAKAVAMDADVVRARVEVEERERRPRALQSALIRDQHRERDGEPLLRVGGTSTGKRRGPCELARLGERSPELRVLDIVRA